MLASKLRTESVSRFLKNAQIIKDFGEIFVRVLFFTYTLCTMNIIAYLQSWLNVSNACKPICANYYLLCKEKKD